MAANLRFYFLTTFYPPYSFGEDGICVERLAHALVSRGHTVTVVHDGDAFEFRRRGARSQSPANVGPERLRIVRLQTRLRN